MFSRAASTVIFTNFLRRTPRLGVGFIRELNNINKNQNMLAEIETIPFSGESFLNLNEKLQVTIKDFTNPELYKVVEILHDRNIETHSDASSESIISIVR